MLENFVLKHWYTKKPTFLCKCLWPFSLLFRCCVSLRKWCYDKGLLSSRAFDVPVIVVGNITVGGSGKTPLVIYLCEQLKRAGYKPGIVSRGYKGSAKTPTVVTEDSHVDKVGDEAVLMAKRCHVPIVVCQKRVNAVSHLLQHFDCNIVLSDDGLQHYALKRDIEIAVLDGKRLLGNQSMLPAGPLREPASRLKTVDIVVGNGETSAADVVMTFVPMHFIQCVNHENAIPVDMFHGDVVHAVAGIGHPERFFSSLTAMGLIIIKHVFPDHHVYVKRELMFQDAHPIVMTEKDAVKCGAFVNKDAWYLQIDVDIDVGFMNNVLNRLKKGE